MIFGRIFGRIRGRLFGWTSENQETEEQKEPWVASVNNTLDTDIIEGTQMIDQEKELSSSLIGQDVAIDIVIYDRAGEVVNLDGALVTFKAWDGLFSVIKTVDSGITIKDQTSSTGQIEVLVTESDLDQWSSLLLWDGTDGTDRKTTSINYEIEMVLDGRKSKPSFGKWQLVSDGI